MKNAMSWAQYIATQILIFACLYAWKIGGVEGAGNLLQVMLWTFAAAGIAVVSIDARGKWHPRSEIRKAAYTCNTLILLAALCWFGEVLVAGAYALGAIGFEIYRGRFDAEGNPMPLESSKPPPTDASSHGWKP